MALQCACVNGGYGVTPIALVVVLGGDEQVHRAAVIAGILCHDEHGVRHLLLAPVGFYHLLHFGNARKVVFAYQPPIHGVLLHGG